MPLSYITDLKKCSLQCLGQAWDSIKFLSSVNSQAHNCEVLTSLCLVPNHPPKTWSSGRRESIGHRKEDATSYPATGGERPQEGMHPLCYSSTDGWSCDTRSKTQGMMPGASFSHVLVT